MNFLKAERKIREERDYISKVNLITEYIKELVKTIDKNLGNVEYKNFSIEGNTINITVNKYKGTGLSEYVINRNKIDSLKLVNICYSDIAEEDVNSRLRLYITESVEYDEEDEFNPEMKFYKLIIHLGYEDRKEEILFVYEIDIDD